MAAFAIRAPRFADFESWKLLFEGYNAFYGREGPTALAPAIVATTWARIHDEDEPVHALVAEEGGQLVGLAHYLFHRSTTATAALPIVADTVLLHGDTPGAVQLARQVRAELERAGVTIAPLAQVLAAKVKAA